VTARLRGPRGSAPDTFVLDIPVLQNRFVLSALQSLGYDVSGLSRLGSIQGILGVQEVNGHVWVERLRLTFKATGATAELFYEHQPG